MTNQTYLAAIASLISLLGICYLLLWRYRSVSMDFFRQKMFELRDELFDYAANGHIGFDHSAYAVLRNTMNGYLQFGHRFTALQALAFFVLLSKEDKAYMQTHSFESVWSRAVKTLNAESKQQLEVYRDRMHTLAMTYIVISSPICLLILVPILAALMVVLVVGRLWKFVDASSLWASIRQRFNKTDNVALIYGGRAAA